MLVSAELGVTGECREGAMGTTKKRTQLWPFFLMGYYVGTRVNSEEQGHVSVASQEYSCVWGGGWRVMCCSECGFCVVAQMHRDQAE